MNIDIRTYQPADLHDLLYAWESASQLAHPFMPPSFFEQERYNIPHVYLPNTDTWVVCVEGKVEGFIALMDNEVGGFFVDPTFHGQGLGQALMNKACTLHDSLVVDVFKDNKMGCRFYQQYGFTLIEEKTWDETGDAMLRLGWAAS
ncbi:GNAT family N-acetyltransferase [Shewanella surugensis]|uniref:GNAT family N-acetyltransferase n=1 Tax=Shewanella surugensis TaxID=212020 RepID=A0ABT0LJI3_9GAMM|nr:GNAT family N-acetyltransferase [Shewanella surugensis]MCL1127525.1 GNAT family N-acetyltransferase [Shewanella surugensis]